MRRGTSADDAHGVAIVGLAYCAANLAVVVLALVAMVIKARLA